MTFYCEGECKRVVLSVALFILDVTLICISSVVVFPVNYFHAMFARLLCLPVICCTIILITCILHSVVCLFLFHNLCIEMPS